MITVTNKLNNIFFCNLLSRFVFNENFFLLKSIQSLLFKIFCVLSDFRQDNHRPSKFTNNRKVVIATCWADWPDKFQIRSRTIQPAPFSRSWLSLLAGKPIKKFNRNSKNSVCCLINVGIKRKMPHTNPSH